jgi:hypothetical protein
MKAESVVVLGPMDDRRQRRRHVLQVRFLEMERGVYLRWWRRKVNT